MAASEALSRAVRSRAHGRCQYCLMHESLQGATFHVEHVIPQSKGGESTLENLALACPGCNLHKTDKTTAADPPTGEQVALFHPLRHLWSEHFQFKGYEIEGRTPVGRATVAMLDLNHSRRLRVRQVEETFGLYPPTP
ncbi:MAG TPA: HNH endonuclease signature motif containing protein [Candidatus Acidoferrum sp.]|nr:HNH endonuclease signature motif containing protein [Candidatus Acidoferrum sp.]